MPQKPIHRIKGNAAVQAALAAVISAQAAFVATLAELDELRHPEGKAERLRVAMLECTNAAELAEARRMYAEVTGPAGTAGKVKADGLATEALTRFVATLPPLLKAGEAAAADLVAEALVAETAMFSGFDMKRVPTPVSAAAEKIAADVREMQKAVAGFGFHHVSPHAGHFASVVKYFVA
jgi:hypothetical protein